MKSIYKIISTAMLFLLISGNLLLAGGGNRNATSGAVELLIPVGVRGISIGGSNVSTTNGIEALYWNPAGISVTNNTVEAAFSYMSYIADIGVAYGAVSTNVKEVGTFALSVKALNIGEIPVTTTTDPDGTGQMFTPQYITAGLSYSRKLSDRIAVGLTGNLVSEQLGQVSATGFAFNIGVMYENLGNINGLSMGVVMKNLGPQMQFDGTGLYVNGSVANLKRSSQYYKIDSAPFDLPSSLEFGFGYRRNLDEDNALLFTGTFQSNNFSGDAYNIGGEYTYHEIISLRAGYALVPENQETGYIYGLSAGMGLQYDLGGTNVKVDYAYRAVDVFDGNHVFSLSVGF